MTFIKFRNIFLLLSSVSLMHCNNNGIYDLINSTTNPYAVTKKVFVTSVATLGDMSFQSNATIIVACPGLTGIPKANCACQTLASQAGLTNKGEIFKAWLSESGSMQAAICNIQGFSGNTCSSSSSSKYTDLNGNVIFNSLNDIIRGSFPLSPIAVTETGGAPSSINVWTGSDSFGQPLTGSDCTALGQSMAWTDAGGTSLGTVGNDSLFDSGWTNDTITGAQSCGPGIIYPIYCFEQ